MPRSSILLAAAVFCAALTHRAGAQGSDVAPVQVVSVAEKLGVKLVPSAPYELELGRSVTATLAEPKKLGPYGIKGMHEGARVTIKCVGPNHIRVEADEIEPVAQTSHVILKIGADGSLTAVADRPSPVKPPGA